MDTAKGKWYIIDHTCSKTVHFNCWQEWPKIRDQFNTKPVECFLQYPIVYRALSNTTAPPNRIPTHCTTKTMSMLNKQLLPILHASYNVEGTGGLLLQSKHQESGKSFDLRYMQAVWSMVGIPIATDNVTPTQLPKVQHYMWKLQPIM